MLALVFVLLAQAPTQGPWVTAGTYVDPLHPVFEFATTGGLGMGTWDGGVLPACGQCDNLVSYPEALDNAVWSTLGGGGIAAPTITANVVVAPWNALVADRVQFPAAGATPGGFSQMYQSALTPSATNTCSAYVMGNGTSGTLNMRITDSVGHCTGCSYVAGSWTRCSFTQTLDATASPSIAFGSFSTVTYPCTGSDGLAFDGYITGVKCKVESSASAYYAQPAGTRLEPQTFTRASNATCMKGSLTTGIANGDLLTCPTGVPRVMPGGTTTAGTVKGQHGEGARTNYALRSQQFDQAAVWQPLAAGASLPTVTADQAVAPDGTTTADRIQFGATDGSGTQYSILFQTMPNVGQPVSGSLFFKGNGTSGSLDIGVYTGAAYVCASCSYVSGSWTRCSDDNVSQSGASPTMLFGNAAVVGFCNRGAQPAADVFVWAGQYELGSFTSSYIATTSAGVTRAADSSFFAWPYGTLQVGSMAATLMPQGVTGLSEISWFSLQDNAGPTYDRLLIYVNANAFRLYGPSGPATIATLPPVVGTEARLAGYWTGTDGTVIYSGSTTSAGIGVPVSQQRLTLGNYATTTSPAWGVVKQVCVDSRVGGCR